MYHIARGGLAFLRTFQTVLQRDWTLFFFFILIGNGKASGCRARVSVVLFWPSPRARSCGSLCFDFHIIPDG